MSDSAATYPAVPPYGTAKFRHQFDAHPGAEFLIILFAGFTADPATRIGWPYRNRMVNLPAHRLYVLPQTGPVSGPLLDIPALTEFVNDFHARAGVPAERTIACGSSLGATIALGAALRAGYGYAVVGSPIVLVGDYLEDGFIPEDIRASIAGSRKAPGPEPGEDATEKANRVLLDGVRQVDSQLEIDLFVGESDYFYPFESDALADAADDNPYVTLKRTIVPDVTHQNMYRPFGRHLSASLGGLIGGTPAE